MTSCYRRENARRDAAYKTVEHYTPEETAEEREKGDRATFFRSTV